MKYFVDWTPAARAHLATIWLQASDRQAVTKAQAAVDKLLAADPLLHVQHLAEGLYAINVYPLRRAKYELADQGRAVFVVSVGQLI